MGTSKRYQAIAQCFAAVTAMKERSIAEIRTKHHATRAVTNQGDAAG
tara:strand:- start:1 stop:141 length:141 start_codon:yes stop_codon:yes gene_type:complete